MRGSMRALCIMLAVCCITSSGADRTPVSCVTAIYPTSPVLPANHLKFYIHFNCPMRHGVFMEHCKLLDDHGVEVLEPFRETELWSEDGLRLTLWLHPGRQKRGVNLNTDFGPVLASGRRYKLVISGSWPTEDGLVNGADADKEFFAGPCETAKLEMRDWQITTPPLGTRSPLEVRFPKPLDHALLLRCLHVLDATRQAIRGAASTTASERCWRFAPEQPWTEEDFALRAETILEDLAGNSLARPFEVDLTEAPQAKVPSTLEIPWKARTALKPGS